MSSKKVRWEIKVKGIVQGVGFRPFVYRLAFKYQLTGRVKNTPQGVLIDLEGGEDKIAEFKAELKSNFPPLAQIEAINFEEKSVQGYKKFEIKDSQNNSQPLTLISPDTAVCTQCKEELQNTNNRRFRYPFINCTDCGPRFSIIKSLPYDRRATTMASFSMCKQCRKEYEDPASRRFHAQPNACFKCGPTTRLIDNKGKVLKTEQPIKEAVGLLTEGKILAVKGLGGFHLICDATQKEVVERLRKRKRRPDKALAVMIKDIKTVKEYCLVRKKEAKILQGIRKPIALLDKKQKLPDNIAPDTNQLGVMLAYTPLHYLLFSQGLEVLVATSANESGLPIEYKNQAAKERLAKIADYFLLHNREIEAPIDDSVVQVSLGEVRVIRRARGYVPKPVRIEKGPQILACGADFKNTFCLSKDKFAFLSQYNGDLTNRETQQRFKTNLNHLKQVYDIEPQIIAHDLHPDYYTTRWAKKISGKKVAVQHHHAHLVSTMAEQDIKPPVIGLVFDGTGLGTDGKIWGGEFLVCNYRDFSRVGHLNYVGMPGGDKAAVEPWRMAVSYLFKQAKGKIDWDLFTNLERKKVKPVVRMLKQDLNCPKTSSLGRLFAGVSALLGLAKKRSYRPQAALKLEQAALEVLTEKYYSYQLIKKEGKYIVDTDLIIMEISKDIIKGEEVEIIAHKFHNTVVNFAVKLAKLIRDEYSLDRVVLSGGAFQNRLISRKIYNQLTKAQFKVYLPQKIPCNDGGLALGQLVVASKTDNRGQITEDR